MGRIVKTTQDVEPPTVADGSEQVAMLVRARAEAKDAAVMLARKMAEKIIGHAVSVDARVMQDIVAQALAAAKPRLQPVLVRVHPEDIAGLGTARTEWLADIGGKGDVQLLADASVGRYGCIVETPHGRLDARLAIQLDALERALLPWTTDARERNQP